MPKIAPDALGNSAASTARPLPAGLPVRSATRRRDDIVDLIERRASVRVEELIDLLGVSRMTVHRDLDALSAEGRIQRVRGGVRKVAPRLTEDDVRLRRTLRTPVKRALAARAADLAKDGDVIVLDDSSTVAQMIDSLAQRKNLTVVTHSLALMQAVADLAPRFSLIGLGGDYFPQTDSFLGLGVARQAAELRADTVFVATTALRNGVLYHPDYDAGVTKRALIDIADRKVLLLDATRFEGRGLYQVVPLAVFDDIVVEEGAGGDRIDSLRAYTDARIHVVSVS
ncbi:MAG: DeoR/GlpR family DNA-binding transcription regulator [Candidatus Accumulibacter sp.]|jgi:DeoR/GlpR family transcriptional regulator of sugar metabolism|nr:DeoR/GlpR family DNA-binding transcription regulator [Accumulibacter sp.]